MSDDTSGLDEPGAEDAPEGEEADTDLDAELAAEEEAPYRPPNFIEALKTVWQPRLGARSRSKAQPASGTDADAKAVNFLDKREQMIAGVLAGFQVLLGIVFYFELRHFVVKPSNKKPKLSVAKAHLDTINDHHLAPELLIVNVILGLATAGGVLSKRRSLVGFTLLLGGFGLLAYGGGIVGIIYVVVGLWLIFRSLRRSPSARTAGATTRAPRARGQAGAQPVTDRDVLTTGAKATAAAVHGPTPASKRYTPPRPRRPSPPKSQPKAEPEKESKLMSWLRR